MGKLFGTDGIRGVANQYPMTPELALTVGRAVASFFTKQGAGAKIVIGKDTRISGDMIECALVAGICSMGVDAYRVDILPTPGVAVITNRTGADAGIMISASHNPFYDNGIKIFNGEGYKLTDEKEQKIERLVLEGTLSRLAGTVRQTGRVYTIEEPGKRYAEFLIRTMPEDFSLRGLTLVLDCANGATHKIAPDLFSHLGADVHPLFVSPDGRNINADCGSEHPEALQTEVVRKNADMGLAFDGDGDRLIVVDEKGDVLTGDQIMAICAKFLKAGGKLRNNCVVSTVMSNLGFAAALEKMGVDHWVSKVGDRYVLEQMLAKDAVLGGEDSGHMIFLDWHTTGDGLLAALKLIEVVGVESKPLSELGKIMTVFPQVLLNVPVKDKPDIKSVSEIVKEIESVGRQLGKKGRVLVRYSGTQPICRVMVEGPSVDRTKKYCQQIADAVRKALS
jgi:phosphoglucosamine mutase